MKPIHFVGTTEKAIKKFNTEVQRHIQIELFAIQNGHEPTDWKPMNIIGMGVKEIRIHAHNEYRIIYVAKFKEAVYVLHAFEKKSQATSKKDIELAKRRYKQLIHELG
jgi:phage-related protein